MTSGLVNASYSLPEGQAVKMIFFAPCDPLLTAAQLSLGYTFCDMTVSVLPLLTDATNLHKIQVHRPMNTMFLNCCYVFVQKKDFPSYHLANILSD